MTRREFLKGAGAFVLLCAAGWKGLDALEKSLAPSAENAAGPLLQKGLFVAPTASGANVSYGGQLLFTVNETGRKLLALADGTNCLDTIIKESGTEKNADETCMFFVTLGKAGYLQNRVEVRLYES